MVNQEQSATKITAPSDAMDVFLLIGQSNMVGTSPDDGIASHPADTWQWVGSQLLPATKPLRHPESKEGFIGLDIAFANEWRAHRPERRIVFVPMAVGGTGFCDKNWNPTDPLYTDAVHSFRGLKQAYPASVLRAILWHQGERDRHYPEDYGKKLAKMITQLRLDLPADEISVPFLMGEISDDICTAENGAKRVRDQQLEVAETSLNVTCVSARQPFVLQTYDGLHFDTLSISELGRRYAQALLEGDKDYEVTLDL